MKKIRFFLLGAVIITSLLQLSFAGGQTEKKQDGMQGAAQKTEISMWHFPQINAVPGFEAHSKDFGDFWNYLSAEFNKSQNKYEVKTELLAWDGGTEKANVAIAGGSPPEIIFDYLGRTSSWYTQGAAVAAEDIVPQKMINDIQDSIKTIYTIDGKVHALPGFTWNMNLNVNVGLLEKYGWKGPILNGPGKTYSYEQFTEFLRKVKETVPSDVYPMVMQCGSHQGDYVWWQFFWGFGGKLFNQDGTVASDMSGMIEGYKYFLKLREEKLIAPGVASLVGGDTTQMWASGKSVVEGGNLYNYDLIDKAVKEGHLDYDLNVIPIPFPSESGNKGYNANGPTGFIFFSESEAKQSGSSEWVQFVMSDKYWGPLVTGSGQFPLQKSMAGKNLYEGNNYQSIVSEMMSKFSSGNFGLASPNYQKIRIKLSETGQKIFSDRATVEQAVEDFYSEVKKLEQ